MGALAFQLEKLLHEKRFQRKIKNGGKVAINVVESQPINSDQLQHNRSRQWFATWF